MDTVKEGGSDADAAIESDNSSQKRRHLHSDSPDGERKKYHFNFDADIEALCPLMDQRRLRPPFNYLFCSECWTS